MLAIGFSAAAFLAQPAGALPPTPATVVGDIVTNPVTGVDSEVVEVFMGRNGDVDTVLTAAGETIVTKTMVGDTIEPVGTTDTFEVISVVTNAGTGFVETTNIRLTTADPGDPTTPVMVVGEHNDALDDAEMANQGSDPAPPVIPPTATSGIIDEVHVGAKGAGGSNAYGVSIPTPWGSVTIAKTGSDGDPGDPGPDVDRDVLTSHGPITSTAANTPGITVGSVGGDGGEGGDSFGNIDAYNGGPAGDGGTVDLDNRTSVTTTKAGSHGVFAFSRSGKGGDAGDGFIFAEGGNGGQAFDGGAVFLKNSGQIGTVGDGSHGLYALSVGGTAGDGGNSWGIVGEGGSGATGGNGGNVEVTNNALVQTEGVGSHGILAQSVGGTGGDGGSAGGIVAFGGDAENGGEGGNVTIINQADAEIQTTKRGSVGVFGQSVGGSGGDSGVAGGIVGLGASGGTGNHAGTVTITNLAGSKITTMGQDSHGVFGQSVGGGGGNSSPTGGLVSIGGSASGGGDGKAVTIDSAAVINTGGTNSHGIFAQSIGGGGGSAGAGGGLVSLGGDGGAGGQSGMVMVTNRVEGSITTTGVNSHAIFAQSIGGGGGAGGDSGGLVSIGGKGSSGGMGGEVSVTNSGLLETTMKDSRGIFAQSIGGGGGSGGGSGGLVSLGGGSSTGSNAKMVTVTNNATGNITTHGEGADAIFAQSIGGGGGSGAGSGGLVSLGGTGSGGGLGGKVYVTNHGDLETAGALARGIFAQSIGGGGGSGGDSGGLVSIGGSAGFGSDAGEVMVDNTGFVETKGDRSTGIFAQSVGGGGGDGGASGGMVSVGGSGDAGGKGGKVTVKHSGDIFTGLRDSGGGLISGDDAHGIFAQSVGGGGGNGGSSTSVSAFVGVAVGGSGGKGGDGGIVDLTLEGKDALTPSTIRTQGDRSAGIFAQSVGGGGGNGGGAVSVTGGYVASASIAVGGAGGDGGKGGVVSMSQGTGFSIIETAGDDSTGAFLQSVGGGGGNGGYAVAVSIAVGDIGAAALSVGVGGKGGKGGAGGTVTVGSFDTSGNLTAAGLNGTIHTKGERSAGFIAQSVGGGGGNGGLSVSAAVGGGAVAGAGISVGVGGTGGDGGAGGTVMVGTQGNITTEKDFSPGMLVQSVGGGGGNGGGSISGALSGGGAAAGSVAVGLGGLGGSGNTGGDVTLVTLAGTVTTSGSNSTGITAQSIGGGGGNGGYAIAAGLSGAGTGAGSVTVGLGGDGGAGAHGGDVRADLQSIVNTFGHDSGGIVVQSVGGGGGNGGFSVSASLAGGGVAAGTVGVGLGGKGTAGGDGGTVDAKTWGKVTTKGDNSTGILAQSVGGGGGSGGFNVSATLSGAGTASGAVGIGLGGDGGGGGHGSTVMLTVNNDVETGVYDPGMGLMDWQGNATDRTGNASAGVVAQSIGGGGGNGGFNVSVGLSGSGTVSGSVGVGLGGDGAGAGDGGNVTAIMVGNITTRGHNAGGLVVQSVGGGGGNGGFNVSGSISGAGTASGGVSVGLGGGGGKGGSSAKVVSSLTGDTMTLGDYSTGVTAQSLGGGGGNGGFNVSGAISGAGTASGGVSVGLGGGGGDGGSSGAAVTDLVVDNFVKGNVTTFGIGSGGVLAQSLGGGGGNGGFNVSGAISGAGTGSGAVGVGLGGSGGGGGNSAIVKNRVEGDVTTSGRDSFGVLAQSVGGGGGNGGFNVAGVLSGAGTGSGGIGVGIGGSGGRGGHSGALVTETAPDDVADILLDNSTIVVDNTVIGDVMTDGVNSAGVVAQSLGGGGGNGGFNVSGSISAAGTGSGAVSVGLGGSGGKGGHSSGVKNYVEGDVTTLQKDSGGVLAQSVGGGGGNGGFSVGAVLSGAGTGSGGVSVSIGGSGGGGGHAGSVDNTVIGDVTTRGDSSSGVVAQSIGGGGGNGGFTVAGAISGAGTGSGAVSVGIGGSGGGGGNAGKVVSSVTGDVITTGVESDGIVAQSLGGGGGNGGFTVSGAISAARTGAGSVAVGIGGSGGGGGDAGITALEVDGDVMTFGDRADGIVAQSLGGGGGNGGFNINGGFSAASTGAGNVGVGVGGSGGDGGHSGGFDAAGNVDPLRPRAVSVMIDGNVWTDGTDARGVVAQAIGGGGGNGGFNVTAGLAVAKTAAGNIGVGIGGSGGSGGNAGEVHAMMTGDINTTKDGASGMLVQSVGGGGGNGGFNAQVALSASSTGAGNIGVGVGGAGGDGGIGGKVVGTLIGDVRTLGDDGYGVLMQSVGGGGGNGGFNLTAGLSASKTGAGNLGIGVGGFGGGGGKSGNVIGMVTGDVTTGFFLAGGGRSGEGAFGIAMQSIAGGGGNGGFNITGGLAVAKSAAGNLGVGVGGFGGDGAAAGAVKGTILGNVVTVGDSAHGTLLQSVGGGGGNGGFNVTAGLSLSKSMAGTLGVGIGGFGGLGGDAGRVVGDFTGDTITYGDDSFGVLAQSLGGGGGNGGLNVSGGLTLSKGQSAAGSIGIGGFGGDGGKGSSVVFELVGTTVTLGSNSDGVVVQSIGGGGGNGGINISGSIGGSKSGTAATLAFGLGGSGGTGSSAGNVYASVTGDVWAFGLGGRDEGSNGIVAQSLGGGGGNGGINVSGGISLTNASGGNASGYGLTIGIGGSGGTGGSAGTVQLNVLASTVLSHGDDKSAVTAQSIGGGGGNGAINISGGITKDGAVTAGVGGSGGDGGTGNDVTANVETNIFADGMGSRGLLAQSVGGGGGHGGMNISGGITTNTSGDDPSLVFGLGGSGGAGNTSRNVTVTQKGIVVVSGVNSIGIVAQSIAGGGGDGGLNVAANVGLGDGYAAAIGIGGDGGTGANVEGTVRLTSDGLVSVDGRSPAPLTTDFDERATGILAQSVGGGGGSGGMNVSGVGIKGKTGSPLAVAIGADGGGGGNAGDVFVIRGMNEASTLDTFGNQAAGLVAQSVGGGGGNAGMNFALAASPFEPGEEDKKYSLLFVMGGDGGSAGDGMRADVKHVGDITTRGEQSVGLIAQSIGGGGGNANYNVGGGFNKKASSLNLAIGGGTGSGGSGGTVVVDHTGDISTTGADSSAILAQSIGGGGGNTAMNMAVGLGSSNSLNVSIGRSGGTGGSGGDVTVSSDGMLSTVGDRSVGVMAQSIGGGGGRSGTTSVGVASSSGEGEKAKSTGVNMAIGLKGGTGGKAGNVSATVAGRIATQGVESHAIHAQSIGGGGGVGGAATNINFQESTSVKIGVGGEGAPGADAGTVDVTNSATLTTVGERAFGVNAQSIGGGGGTGGYAGVIGLQIGGAAANGNNSVGVSVGGDGGKGGEAQMVTVDNSGFVMTTGEGSIGVSAQSIGGGGGDGGIVINGTIAGKGRKTALELAVGGTGGDGGIARDVSVINSGIILTTEASAHGIRAQSIGGGGGDAGLVAQVTISKLEADASSKSTIQNIGGDGGIGGVAGNVTVDNRASGEIYTQGIDAYGILAQSIGGGGGNGSSVISANFSTGSKRTTVSSTNVGGKGGEGGKAGTVTVLNDGFIQTEGDGAHAILAQSIGGGGGNGGLILATNAVMKAGAKSKLVNKGSDGGMGADAGDVTVKNSGQIVTLGDRAHGIQAQSIGGGGGNAGLRIGFNRTTGKAKKTGEETKLTGKLKVKGGSVGTGGMGGDVTVEHTGDITVLGQGSQAIKAESINGGGGSTALDFDGITSLPGGQALPGVPDGTDPGVSVDPLLEIDLGGRKQKDTAAGEVTVTATGTFGAAGDNGLGAGAQSIGGGGGTTALALALADISSSPLRAATRGPDDGALGIDLALGGVDGANNSGNAVTSALTGDIVTTGDNSPGVGIQSIGGGGGRGNVTVTGDLAGLDDVVLRLGGKRSTSEMGGAITLERTGQVTTQGEQSHGVLLQSIGGGGGSISLRIDGDSPAGTPLAPLTRAASGGGATRVRLGGIGGTGLDGGDVTAMMIGDVTTTGANAVGIVVQSIGAGGGEARTAGTNGLEVRFGGNAGANGDGGDITVDNVGAVTTTGDRAHGVFLQSIGGGGGAVFHDDDDVAFSVSPFNSGDGGDISFLQTGDIGVFGAQTYGLFAQSLGGGGGFADGVGALTARGAGVAGAISVVLDGSVMVTDRASTAVYLESTGADGAGDIDLLLNAGFSLFGGADGQALSLVGGATNLFVNHGLVTTAAGVDGMTILGTTGDDGIISDSHLIGSIDLGGGANSLANLADGLFEMGGTVDLGVGNLFSNAGTLSHLGYDRFGRTDLRGNFAQSGTPTWLIDLAGYHSDGMYATGTANLAGSTTLVELNAIVTPTRTGYYTLLRANEGLLTRGVFEFGSYVGDGMPIGRTFDIVQTSREVQLSLLPSTGDFYWRGNNSSTWSDPFIAGVANWSRERPEDYIYGTPGADSNVFFVGSDATNLGADFEAKSLNFIGAGGASISSRGETLTLFHGGIKVGDSALRGAAINVDLKLGAHQKWINNGGLLAINGGLVWGSGRDLTVDGSGDTVIRAAIRTGPGSLTKAGGGTLYLLGRNSYSGGTLVSDGLLVGNTVSLQGAIENNALTMFLQDVNGLYAGRMTGTGVLIKQGTGTLRLSGANSYSGGTFIGEGALIGSTTSVQGDILNLAALEFEQNFNGTYAGMLGGDGSLTKSGTGALTMTGNSLGFGGTSTVSAGSLFVDGGLGGTLFVESGALLGGCGIIPDTTIRSGATLAPGSTSDCSAFFAANAAADGAEEATGESLTAPEVAETGEGEIGGREPDRPGLLTQRADGHAGGMGPADQPGAAVKASVGQREVFVAQGDASTGGHGVRVDPANGASSRVRGSAKTVTGVEARVRKLEQNGPGVLAQGQDTAGGGDLGLARSGAFVQTADGDAPRARENDRRGSLAQTVEGAGGGELTAPAGDAGVAEALVAFGRTRRLVQGASAVPTSVIRRDVVVARGERSDEVFALSPSGPVTGPAGIELADAALTTEAAAGVKARFGRLDQQESDIFVQGLGGTAAGDIETAPSGIFIQSVDGDASRARTSDAPALLTQTVEQVGGGDRLAPAAAEGVADPLPAHGRGRRLVEAGSGIREQSVGGAIVGDGERQRPVVVAQSADAGDAAAFAAGGHGGRLLRGGVADTGGAGGAAVLLGVGRADAGDGVGVKLGTAGETGRTILTAGAARGRPVDPAEGPASGFGLVPVGRAGGGAVADGAAAPAGAGTFDTSGVSSGNGLGGGVAGGGNSEEASFSIGALLVNGNITLEAGSTYAVDTEAYGPSDVVLVTGDANLLGGLVDVTAGGDERYRPINEYLIFNSAGEIIGTFDGVTVDLAFLDPSLQYGDDYVILTLRRNDVDFRQVGTQGNQISFAAMMNGLVPFATGDLASFVNTIYDLSDAEALTAMNTLTGVLHQYVASGALFNGDSFVQTNLRRLSAVTSDGGDLVQGNGLGFAAPPRRGFERSSQLSRLLDSSAIGAGQASSQKQGLWASGLSDATEFDGNQVDSGAKSSSRGLVMGFDVSPSAGWTLGLSGAYSRPEVDLYDLADRMETRLTQFGLYGRYGRKRSRFDLVVAVGNQTNETQRTVTNGIGAALARASYGAETVTSHVGYGYAIDLGGGVTLEPQVGYQFGRVRLDAFSETGAGVLSLVTPGRTAESQRSLVGARLGKTFQQGVKGSLRVEARAAWVHEFDEISDLNTRLLGDTFTNGFVVVAPNRLRDSGLFGASIGGRSSNGLRYFANADVLVSGPVTSWSTSFGVEVGW